MDFVSTEKAPGAIGPYSQATRAGGFVFTAGQVGLDPETMKLVDGGVEAETRQAMQNLQEILEAAGTSLQYAVKTSIFLADMNDFKTVNAVYAEAMGDHRPARSTVEVSVLPLSARVEIDMVAQIKE